MAQGRARAPGLFVGVFTRAVCVRDDAGDLVVLGAARREPPLWLLFVWGLHSVAQAGVIAANWSAASTGGVRAGAALLSPILAVLAWAAIALLAWLLTSAFTQWRSRRRARPRSRLGDIARPLSASRCPSCGYGLGDCHPGIDGLSRCPECGSAWNLALWAEEWPPLSMSDAHSGNTPGRRTLDARRRRVPTPTPGSLAAPAAGAWRAAMHRGAVERKRAWAAGAAVWLAAGLMIALNGWRLGTWGGSLWGNIQFGAMISSAYGVPWLLAMVMTRTRPAYIAAMVESSLCPSCASDLRNEPTRLDGLFLCRRCGAAWRRAQRRGARPARPAMRSLRSAERPSGETP